MTKTTHTTQADDSKLVKIADQLEADQEMYEATLDGLNARIDANIAKLEGTDIDASMAAADDDVASMAADVLKKDTEEMEEVGADADAVDAEEDQNLSDDELPPEETAAKLTVSDTGLPEQG
jgi:ribosomal protein L12E/L44/L45/RPP1/RPP2